MNEAPSSPDDNGSLIQARRVDQVCARFEDAWRAGRQPRIEDYLPDLPEPQRPGLLRELLHLEIQYRRQNSDPVNLVELERRFPDQVRLIRSVFAEAQLPDQEPSTGPGSASPGAAVANLPERLGRYRITARLGRGSFGVVYQGRDDDLQRDVAIKVPHRERIARPEDVEAYLTEAQVLARLDHPHIVPVYDVGRTDDGLCFVVSKLIEGSDLARQIRGEPRRSFVESADLVRRVAEALHCAHLQGLVHRDIKPGNILLDRVGKPYVADFGLALKEEDVGKAAPFAGTPAYMSPEQARGEGHRVDGRADLFSLGVVFYELLTGRRPFRAAALNELLEQITRAEARPPRQVDDTIPRELERICLKALARRAADRYTTGEDLAADLRHWLAGDESQSAVAQSRAPVQLQVVMPAAPTPDPTPAPPGSDAPPVKVVPKGLRSFDARDANFFLDLLPGPRDRDGLPDSLGFWKSRIEDTDPDQTFAVGLLYGPSGCGKSSLMKAGLLPRLAPSVLAVYIEATADDTGARLVNGIRKQCPDLAPDLGLVDTLAALRKGHGLPAGRKVLLVLDQFEQWLHARHEEEEPELVAALRHCDGEHLQALVLVRDDFWLAVVRFLADLEIDPIPGRNTALVDLFDLRHARKVLAAFGRAFGTLPERAGEMTRDQQAFLDQALAGLAQEGKVISVRLALFAEMVKAKPWTAATLKEVGGTEGVGVRFLEETFSSAAAAPAHRLHQQAARAVLKRLLPERGTDIKGTLRTQHELGAAAGYASRPKDFATLLRILDSELRLITPTDPEGVAGDGWRVPGEEGGEGNDGGAALPTIGSVADGHGAGGEMLSGDKNLPEGGAVRVDKPDPPGGGIDPGQHRRGPGQGAHERVSQPPEHRPGIPSAGGNAPDAESARRLAAPRGAGQSAGANRPHQPDAQWPAQGAAAKAQGLNPATHHPPPATRYYQLTHDYLVPALREWLTRKQKETRRGRAELRLTERAALWQAKPQNRHLPAWWEWLNIRLFTRPPDWTASQAQMMRKAQRFHLTRGAVLAACLTLLGLGSWDGIGRFQAHRYRDRLLDAGTAAVPEVVADMAPWRWWIDPLLREAYADAESQHDARKQLHASLALLPRDPSQVDYLVKRLLAGTPEEVAAIRTLLAQQQDQVVGRLWTVLGDRNQGLDRRLRAACALARYVPDDERWANVGEDLTAKLVTENSLVLGKWSELLRPVGRWLWPPLAKLLDDEKRKEMELGTLATLFGTFAAGDAEAFARLEKGLRVDSARRQARLGAALLLMGRDEQVWPLLKHSSDPTVRSYLMEWLGPAGVEPGFVAARLEREADVSIRRALLLSLGTFDVDRLPVSEREQYIPRLLELYRDEPDAGLHGAAEWVLRQWGQHDALREIDRSLATGQAAGQRRWYVNRQGQTFTLIPRPGEVTIGGGNAPEKRRIDWTFAIAAKDVTVAEFLKLRPGHKYTARFAPKPDCPMNEVSWYDAAAYCNWLSKREGIPEDQWCYEPNAAGQYAEGMKIKASYWKLSGYRLPTEAEWEYAARAGSRAEWSCGSAVELLEKYAWYNRNSLGTTHPVGRLKPNDWGLFDMQGNVWQWCQDRYEPRGGAENMDKTGIEEINSKNGRVMHGGSFLLDAVNASPAFRYRNAPEFGFNIEGFRPARTFTAE
jgi:serine/threonine protein kinase/formylglycine-generating enzyme required for sulfatase activity